jgi:hypothetical protein
VGDAGDVLYAARQLPVDHFVPGRADAGGHGDINDLIFVDAVWLLGTRGEGEILLFVSKQDNLCAAVVINIFYVLMGVADLFKAVFKDTKAKES